MSSLDRFKKNIPLINSYLLTAVFFTIPIHVSPAYIVSAIIFLLWLIEGRLAEKWAEFYRNPIVWVFWLYFLIPFISLFWSQDLVWGVKMAKRGLFFFLFPLYLSVVRKDHVQLYINAFIASMILTVTLSYYNWVQLNYLPDFPPGIRGDQEGIHITPFINYIMYNPILAFCAYLLGYSVLFEKLTVTKRFISCGFLGMATIYMFISGGRSGQLGFFAMLCLLILQRFARRPVVALVVALGVTMGGFFAAYHVSDLFRERADLAVYEMRNYKQAVNSSVGLRITYTVNTLRMFLESPILGVGVGDYPAEYRRINSEYTPQWETTFNPHNQYMFALSTTGLLGGVILLGILLGPPYLAHALNDEWSKLRIALPVLFIVICFGESYLWRSNTSLLFVLFSAVLYFNVTDFKTRRDSHASA